MDVTGRMIDSIAEAPQSRRAKASAAPASDEGQATGLSFAETLIGLVQPPSVQEPSKTSSEPSPAQDKIVVPAEAPQTSTPESQDAQSALAFVATNPAAASAPVTSTAATNPQSDSPQPVAPVLNLAGEAPAAPTLEASVAKVSMAQGGDDLVEGSVTPKATPSPVLMAEAADMALKPVLEPAATPQAVAVKAQAAASQGLLAGLAALGQTIQPAGDDVAVAQVLTNAAAPTAAPFAPALPSQSDAAAAQTPAPTLNLALASNSQGPSAIRAQEAQAGEGRGFKATGSGFSWTQGNGLLAPGDAGLQSAPTPSPASPLGQQIAAAPPTGIVPNLAKAAAKTEEAKVTATDTSGLLSGSSTAGDAASTQTAGPDGTPAQDTTPKPSLVQPHTLPMLAAAMMRRISNGMKEFTLRLDPPELGRVDVRLTVGADKKVRAVVSTDRPEALKDLALSARDLTRALQEAGLDLEENGLSFSMNDQGSSQQNRDTNQQQSARLIGGTESYETAETAKAEAQAPLTNPLSGPVERWQRARIALTA